MKKASEPSTQHTEGADAIDLLVADHKKVAHLFKAFESLVEAEGSDDDKENLVVQLCNELTIHMQVEEELFYPAVQRALDEDSLMDEAYVEHASARQLIEQLQRMQPHDPLYEAKVVVLQEQIEHHVKEEEKEMFPKAKKAKVDLIGLGVQMANRKSALKAELGMSDDDGESPTRRERGRAAPRTAHASVASGK